MYPLVGYVPSEKKYDTFTITSPSNGDSFEYGVPVPFVVNRNTTETGIKPAYIKIINTDPISLSWYKFKEHVYEFTGSEFSTNLTFDTSGANIISAKIIFEDGTESALEEINVNVSEDPSRFVFLSPKKGDVFPLGYPISFKISRFDKMPILGSPTAEILLNDNTLSTKYGNYKENIIEKIWENPYAGNFILFAEVIDNQKRISLPGGWFDVRATPTTWEFEMPENINFPLGESVTFIIKPRHNHNFTGNEKITNIKLYANGNEINVTNEFGDNYNFDENSETIEISRVWKPEIAGDYKIKGTLEVDGKIQHIRVQNILINENISNNGNNRTVSPTSNTTAGIEKETNFYIYPNPSKDGSFYLQFDLENDFPITAKIFDTTGRLVYIKNDIFVNKGQNTLFFETKETNLTAGIYTIKLTNKALKKTFTLVVE